MDNKLLIIAAVVIGAVAVCIGTGIVQSDDGGDEQQLTPTANDTNVVWEIYNGMIDPRLDDDSCAYDANGADGVYFTYPYTDNWAEDKDNENSDTWEYTFTLHNVPYHLTICKTVTIDDGQQQPVEHETGITPSIEYGIFRITFGKLAEGEDHYYVYAYFWQDNYVESKGYVPKEGDTFVFSTGTYKVMNVPGSPTWYSTVSYQYLHDGDFKEVLMYTFVIPTTPNPRPIITEGSYKGYDCWYLDYSKMHLENGTRVYDYSGNVVLEKSTGLYIGNGDDVYLVPGQDLSDIQTAGKYQATFYSNHDDNVIIWKGKTCGTHIIIDERYGYTLSGWNTESDGSGKSYSTTQLFTADDDGVVLYAQWT